MSQTLKNRAYGAAVLTALAYGATYPIAKSIMPEYIRPYGLTLARVIGAATLFWSAGLWMPREKVKKKDLLLIFITAVCGASLNMLFLFKGLSMTSSVNASIIILLAPLFVGINSFLFLKEPLRGIKIGGLVIGLAGAAMIILIGKFTPVPSSSSIKGDLLVAASPFFYSIYLIVMTDLVKRYHLFTITKWSLLFGVFIVAPFGYKELVETRWPAFVGAEFMALAYVIVITSFLVVLLTLYSLKYIKASVFSVFMYLQPIFTILIAHFTEAEPLDFIKILGMLLVFSGCYLVSNEKLLLTKIKHKSV